MSEILNVAEAAALLRVSRKTLYRYIKSGRIRPLAHGLPYRFLKEHLLAQQAPPEPATSEKVVLKCHSKNAARFGITTSSFKGSDLEALLAPSPKR